MGLRVKSLGSIGRLSPTSLGCVVEQALMPEQVATLAWNSLIWRPNGPRSTRKNGL